MEPQQVQQQQQGNDHPDAVGNKNSAGLMCRQSSTRWTPTTDQIRILKDLYYNNGVRSPTAEQIQRISAKLRQYGKIEGKNVFYWFQNHKARERQKKRFTTDIASMHRHPPTASSSVRSACHHHDQLHHHHHLLHHHHYPHVPPIYSKFHNIGSFSCESSPSMPSPGLMMNMGTYGGYGSSSSSSTSSSSSSSVSPSVAMEKSFRDCSITPSGGSMGQHLTWIGIDPNSYSSPSSSTCPLTEKRKFTLIDGLDQTLETVEEEEQQQVETLPLFPMHGLQDIKQDTDYFNGWHPHGDDDAISATLAAGSSRASLELTLNSYAARFPNSP